MSINHERRSRLLEITLKQNAWTLETLMERNRLAMDKLAQVDGVLHEIDSVIDHAEATIRRDMSRQSSLDVAALMEARQFLDDQQCLRGMKLQEQQRATQRVHQAEAHLKQEMLFDKALKQVKETSDREITRDREKRLTEQNAELWMQGYGRELWKAHR